jgi:LacI family transcriptional regulator
MDVARRAGVSKVTVSYVLNGHSNTARISEATSQRVLDAARDLGYSPNAIARMMVKKSGNTLGVVFQEGNYFKIWSSFTNEVMLGIFQATVAQGYDLMLHTGSLSAGRCEADALADGRADGVLILRDQDDQTLTDLLKRAVPTVLFFCKKEDPNVAYVDSDNFLGGKLATEHLIGLGHKSIGMVAGSEHSSSSVDRHTAFKETLGAHGLDYMHDWVVNLGDYQANLGAMIELLKRKDRPTALFCWSDDSALDVLRISRELGIRVPEDLSVVGFDSLASSITSDPPLTSVAQPVREIAKTATELLIQLCRGEHIESRQIIMPVSLDIRGSTCPPKVGSSSR